jgi:hypothetical protein
MPEEIDPEELERRLNKFREKEGKPPAPAPPRPVPRPVPAPGSTRPMPRRPNRFAEGLAERKRMEPILRPKKRPRGIMSNLQYIVGTGLLVLGLGMGYLIRGCGAEQNPKEPVPVVETEEYISLQRRVEELSTQNTELRQEDAQYQTKAEELSTQLSEQRAETEGLRQKNERYEAGAETSRTQIAELPTRLEQKQAELEQRITENQELKNEYAQTMLELGIYFSRRGDVPSYVGQEAYYEKASSYFRKAVELRGNSTDREWLERTLSRPGYRRRERRIEPSENNEQGSKGGHNNSNNDADDNPAESISSDNEQNKRWNAGPYFLLKVFPNQSAENLVGEIGAIFDASENRRAFVGANFPFFQDINEGDENWKPEMEKFHFNGGIELVKNLFLVGGIGFSEKRGEIGGPYFMEEETYTTFSAGLRYITRYFAIGAGHHNRRGFSGSIGFCIPLD